MTIAGELSPRLVDASEGMLALPARKSETSYGGVPVSTGDRRRELRAEGLTTSRIPWEAREANDNAFEITASDKVAA